MTDDDRRLTVADAAARASVSEKTIRRAIDAGDLPGYRPKGVRRVHVLASELDAWADVRVPAAAAAAAPKPRPARRAVKHAATGSVTRLRAIERGEL